MSERRSRRMRGGKEPILAAAIDNFQQCGYHGTSMRDIASDAGITVGSMYHHFSSKQEMLQEIMTRALRDAISGTRRALLGAGTSPTDQLAEIMRAWVTFHASRRHEAIIGASEIRSLDDQSRRLVVALRDEQESLFRDVIERGVDAGEFNTVRPREAAWAIITMGNTVATFFQPAGTMSAGEMADVYAELALGTVRAVQVKPPSASSLDVGPVPNEQNVRSVRVV